jgi:hypothetical protein
MTDPSEKFLVNWLTAAPGLAGVPIVQNVADTGLVRPIVIVAAQYHETLIPCGPYPVARINLDATLETQVNETTDAQHQALVNALFAAIPPYGRYTGPDTTFDQLYFGPVQSAQAEKTELVRAYKVSLYFVCRLTVPA